MTIIYSGDISLTGDGGNTGDLIVNGGTTTLGGNYNVGDNIIITTQGKLVVTGNVGLGIDLFIGYDVAGALTLAAGGRITVPGTAHIASLAGTVATLNIGAAAAAPAAAAGTLNASQLQFGAGSGTIVFNHTGTNYSFAAALSGTGAISQAAGVTHLTGASGGFTGTAAVTGGALYIDNTLGSASVSVASGGTLGGTGSTTGDVTVADGAHLAQTQGSTLSAGSLTLSNDSQVDVTLGAPDSLVPLFSVSGTLVLDGKLNVASSGAFDYGSYALFSYGSVTNNGLTIATLPAGFNPGDWQIQVTGGTVSLVVAAGAGRQYWDGDAGGNTANGAVDGGDGVWVAGATNWTNGAGTINAPWAGEGAVFRGTAGTVTVQGTHTVTSLLFQTDGYRLAAGTGAGLALTGTSGAAINVSTGSAEIGVGLSGTTGAVKLGTGTLVLSAANGYTGLTTIQAGTLALSGAGSIAASSGVFILGGASFDVSGVTTQTTVAGLSGSGGVNIGGQRLVVNSISDSAHAGTISGTGTLAKTGSGTLSLAGTAANLAAVDVLAGTLATSGGNAIGDDTQVNVAAGATLAITGAEVLGTLSGAGTLTHTALLTTRTTGTSTFSGTMGGAGGFFKQGAGTLTLSGTSNHGTAGTVATTVAQGTLVVDGGTISHATADLLVGSAGQAARLQITQGTVSDRNATVSGTAADVTVGAGGTWTNANNLILSSLSGSIATVTVQDGGDMTSTTALLGTSANTGAHVTVTGADSSWINSGRVTVSSLTSGTSAASLTIADGGLVRVDTEGLQFPSVLVGLNGVVNIGAAAGSPAVAAGTLEAPRIQLRNANSTLNFNHTSSITFGSDVTLSSTGAIEHRAGTTVLTGELVGALAGGSFINVRGGDLALNGDNSGYTGITTLYAGTLRLGSDMALGIGGFGNAEPLRVAGNGTVVLANGVSIGNGMVINGGVTASVGVATGQSATYASPIMGSGALAKVDAGTLMLTGSNSYTGGTTVAAGTLEGNTTSLKGAIAVNAGATLVFDQASAGTFAGTLTGTGTVVREGAGALTLSGASGAFSGTVQIGNGTLELAAATSAGTGTLAFAAAGSSTLRLHDFSPAATLSGFGADDVIDLQDMAWADGEAVLSLSGGTLTATQGAEVVTLNFAGLGADAGFIATVDGDGSTLLQVIQRNDAPVLDLNGAAAGTGAALAYTEQAGALAIAPAATLADADSADFAGGRLRVAFTSGNSADDVLALRSDGAGAGQVGVSGSDVTFGGVVIGSVSGGTAGSELVVDFTTAAATAAAVQAVVRAVTFANGSDTPSTAARSIDLILSDGDGTLGGGTDTATATAGVTVTAENDDPTGEVTLSGTATQNAELTADTDDLDDADGLGTFSYEWLRDGTVIDGAQGMDYTLVQADVGHAISVRVSYTDGQGNEESVTSDETAPVANVDDPTTGTPAITGTATEDQVLSADTSGIDDPDGVGSFSYQWLRDGEAIDGADAASYTLGDADVGAQISLQVSFTDGGGLVVQRVSGETAAVQNVNDDPTGNVAITGLPYPGATLAVLSTLQDADGLGSFSYQWLRGGQAIDGANGSSYAVQDEDLGQAISVAVSYVDGHGTSEGRTSAAVVPREPDTDTPTGVNLTTPPEGGTAVGTPYDDTLRGLEGRDTFVPHGGQDFVDGGANIDTVVFDGPRANYTVEREGAEDFVVTSLAGDTVTLRHIERLQFSDVKLAMDLTPAEAQIARMYAAALDRAPDEAGLEFYEQALADGWSLVRMATGFIGSPEYMAEYGGTSDAEFLTRLYENALGRAPDAAGFAFQLDVLAHNPGLSGRAAMLAAFVAAPETQVQLAGLADAGVALYAA